jgi:cystathionine beta-lyase/cystathionine gamma-synthase
LEDAAQPQLYHGVSPPIAMTTNFHRKGGGDGKNYFYTRINNPGFILLAKQLVRLHGGDGAVVFASGMAAISAIIGVFSRPGATVLCGDEIYYEVYQCFASWSKLTDIKVVKVDVCDTQATLAAAAQIDDLCMVYLESSSNPSSRMADLPAITAGIKRLHPKVRVVVDNSWLSPVLFRPLEHGADAVVESATKYISGRGDATLGAVICSKSYYGKIQVWHSIHGAIPSPFNCWLVSKALETLPLRMEQICRSAQIIAETLERVPCVTRVLHPSLPSHPTHERATRLLGEAKSGVVLIHLPLGGDVALALPKLIAPIIDATSYGEAHALVNSPERGNSARYGGQPVAGLPVIDGYWYRIAIGLQPPAEIIRGLLVAFARCLSDPLGVVQGYYPKLGVAKIALELHQVEILLKVGDILVVGIEQTDNAQIAFYEVLENSRYIEDQPHSAVTVRVPPGLKKRMKVNRLRSAI